MKKRYPQNQHVRILYVATFVGYLKAHYYLYYNDTLSLSLSMKLSAHKESSSSSSRENERQRKQNFLLNLTAR